MLSRKRAHRAHRCEAIPLAGSGFQRARRRRIRFGERWLAFRPTPFSSPLRACSLAATTHGLRPWAAFSRRFAVWPSRSPVRPFPFKVNSNVFSILSRKAGRAFDENIPQRAEANRETSSRPGQNILCEQTRPGPSSIRSMCSGASRAALTHFLEWRAQKAAEDFVDIARGVESPPALPNCSAFRGE